jgi:hypothetical protein
MNWVLILSIDSFYRFERARDRKMEADMVVKEMEKVSIPSHYCLHSIRISLHLCPRILVLAIIAMLIAFMIVLLNPLSHVQLGKHNN